MVDSICIGIPACNEEATIEACIRSIAYQTASVEMIVIVCLNGSGDCTEGRVLEVRDHYQNLNIQIAHSKNGISFALNEIVGIARIASPTNPIFFVDADVVLSTNFIEKVLDEFTRNPKLIAVGGWPIPSIRLDTSYWRILLQHILHARAFLPEAEISVRNVSTFKCYAHKYPQENIEPEAELRSKIYFHGRAYALRNPTYFFMPSDEEIVDDTFLNNFIHMKYGPGTIRTRYDAIVYYEPHVSLKSHFMTYWRYYLDSKRIDAEFPEFAEIRRFEQTRLNWSFISKRGLAKLATFSAYTIIKFMEEMLFAILPTRSVWRMWQDNKLK